MKTNEKPDVNAISFELEEGFRVKALSRRSDLPDALEPLRFRDEAFRQQFGWRIGSRIAVQSQKMVETRLREELSLGATSFEFLQTCSFSEIIACLNAIDPQTTEGIELRLNSKPDAETLSAARAWVSASKGSVALGLDPISAYASTKDEISFSFLKDFYRDSASTPEVRAIRVDLARWAEKGASAALEVAIARETIRYLRDRHLEGDLNIEWVTATGVQSFLGMAKLRALRRSLVQAGAGVPTLIAKNLDNEKTVYDAMNGALRSTSAAWAAILGGADTVELSSLDRRLSLTTQLVLRDEGKLGRVLDPALGSYAIESLTHSIEQASVALVDKIKSEGGILGALRSGMIEAECTSNLKWNESRVRQGRKTIVGVNEFVDAREALDSMSDLSTASFSREFERMRSVVSERRQKVPVVVWESELKNQARLDFVRTVLHSGGFTESIVQRSDLSALKAAPIVVVLASDDAYEASLADVIQELRAQRVRKLILAGRPKGKEVEYAKLGIDYFFYAGGDRVEVLKKIFHEQGVPFESAQ